MGASREISKRRDRSGDLRIYHRAAWQCQMPECLCPDGRKIDRDLRGTDDPWAPSIDHIKPLAAGGSDRDANKRAAHKKCNADAAEGQLQHQVRAAPPGLTYRIGDLFPGDQGSAWS
jgi:5-methylcytosine-specific restriction endonuclease McrA